MWIYATEVSCLGWLEAADLLKLVLLIVWSHQIDLGAKNQTWVL